MASEKMVNGGGGGVQIEILKIQVYTFIIASGNNVQGGGGVQFEILNIIQV